MVTCLLAIVVSLAIVGVNCEPVTIVSRAEWGAANSKATPQSTRVYPPPYVVVHHTATNGCSTSSACKSVVKSIQNYHQNTKKWQDIGYNFLIGGDGKVYEGRGWGIMGAHATTYNAQSTGISFIGSFSAQEPSQAQLDALQNLIALGVNKGYIPSDYKLIGHRQANPTECPGNKLFKIISGWEHFARNP